MQSVSITNLPNFQSNPSSKIQFSKHPKTPNSNSSFINGSRLWRHRLLKGLRSTNSSRRRRKASMTVKSTWLFQGSGDGGNAKETEASLERSEAANDDIVIFFFQLDLATRIQCALNMEQYDAAQQLRNKLTEAIEKENYALAAELRGQISKLEAESLAASAKALAYENVQYAFRLGQKVRHKKFGYRAIICGMDPVCCESSSWMKLTNVDKLLRGPNQPFYQVLVDVHADPNLLVAYVSEENLLANDQPERERFDHPYISFLFYGMDSAGDFIPVTQLREKYNRPRHEVPMDMNDQDGGQHFKL